jgi:hypothetical protein
MTNNPDKPTPGPWYVSQVGLTNGGERPITTKNERICTVDCQTPFKRDEGWQAECEVREANARLIAAAPELLDARTQIDHRLEELVGQVDALTAERAVLIRDRDRWAEEAQVNTSPIVAGLMADNAQLRNLLVELLQVQDGVPMTGLEASRRGEAARAALNTGKETK